MKKDIIILIHNLGAGGAQKSLVSFLNTLPSHLYDIDLMVLDESKPFFKKQIPDFVRVIKVPEVYTLAITPGKCILKDKIGLKYKIFKLFLLSLQIITKPFVKRSYFQHLWETINPFIPICENQYDVAISYMDGPTNYYVINKIQAKKKILWIHNDYNKLPEIANFDLNYFSKANNIVTISEECVNSLKENFPSISDKFSVLENISSKNMINKLAMEDFQKEDLLSRDTILLLSIGRYSKQKGFDAAIHAAKELCDRGYKFIWYFIGEGSDREMLEELIDKNELGDYVRLLGLRSNPYPYIKRCDIFVQPSRFEGKSIVLDEAKIMCKPILVTNYSTINDSIINGLNGIIVDFDSRSIADGLELLIRDHSLRSRLNNQLSVENNSNENVIEQYISLIEN